MFDASLTRGTFVRFCTVVSASQKDILRVISTRATFVGKIKERGREIWSFLEDRQAEKNRLIVENIKKYLSRSSKYSAWQKEEAEWRLPVGDTQFDLRTWKIERASDQTCKEVVKRLTEGGKLDKEASKAFEAWGYRMRSMNGNRPFLSGTGYVGTCPGAAKRGDEVVIIIGADLPYVLRPRDDGESYTIVGDCHVHDIMDGASMQQDPKPPVVNITLH
jgi:hypothetical protein